MFSLFTPFSSQLISTSATVSSHLKAGSVFDQARAFSEKSNTKKSSKNYVSDSDSDSDSDNEKRSKVRG